MSVLHVSKYQQIVWLDTLAAAIDGAQLLNGSTPVGSLVAATMTRRSLALANQDTLTMTGSGVTHIGWYIGSTLLFKIPWTGGTAQPGSLVYTFGV